MMQQPIHNYPKIVEAAKSELKKISKRKKKKTLSEYQMKLLGTFLRSTTVNQDTFIPRDQEKSFSLTIHEFPEKILNAFNGIAQKINIKPSKILNILMLEYLSVNEDNSGKCRIDPQVLKHYIKTLSIQTIHHQPIIRISAKDLMEMEEKTSFVHIDLLILEKDISDDLIMDKIGSITHCKQVILPKNMSKLLVLSIVNLCDEIIFE